MLKRVARYLALSVEPSPDFEFPISSKDVPRHPDSRKSSKENVIDDSSVYSRRDARNRADLRFSTLKEEKVAGEHFDPLISYCSYARVGKAVPSSPSARHYLRDTLPLAECAISSPPEPRFGPPKPNLGSSTMAPGLLLSKDPVPRIVTSSASGRITSADSFVETPLEETKLESSLAKRRGFKGSPLFTPAMTKKPTLRSLSGMISPLSPFTPDSTLMPNFIRTPSPRTNKMPVSDPSPVPEDIQENYIGADPFQLSTDSYFGPLDPPSLLVDRSNLYDLSLYGGIGDDKTRSITVTGCQWKRTVIYDPSTDEIRINQRSPPKEASKCISEASIERCVSPETPSCSYITSPSEMKASVPPVRELPRIQTCSGSSSSHTTQSSAQELQTSKPKGPASQQLHTSALTGNYSAPYLVKRTPKGPTRGAPPVPHRPGAESQRSRSHTLCSPTQGPARTSRHKRSRSTPMLSAKAPDLRFCSALTIQGCSTDRTRTPQAPTVLPRSLAVRGKPSDCSQSVLWSAESLIELYMT